MKLERFIGSNCFPKYFTRLCLMIHKEKYKYVHVLVKTRLYTSVFIKSLNKQTKVTR